MAKLRTYLAWGMAAIATLALCGCQAVMDAVKPALDPDEVPVVQEPTIDGFADGEVDDRITALQRTVKINIHCLEDAARIISDIGETDRLVTFGSFVLGDEERARIQSVIDAWERDRRPVSLLLMDMETGAGIAYNIDADMYCASTIKAPFACAVTYYEPSAIGTCYTSIKRMLVESNNEAYWDVYFTYNDPFHWAPNLWRDRVGMEHRDYGSPFIYWSARDLARLWCANWDWLQTENDTTALLKEWLNGTYRDSIYHELYLAYPVYSKAGWDPSYGVCHDAGIVVTPDGTYLIVIMTDRSGYPDEVLGPMVRALNLAYLAYVPQKELY